MAAADNKNNSKAGYLDLIDPQNSVLILIDFQPQMTFGVASIDRQTLINNVVGLAKAAKVFKVPVILSTVETKSFSGPFWPQVTELFPDQKPIERSSMNSWEDAAFVEAVKKTGRKKLIIGALWTEVCLLFPALSALKDGYEVYAVEDCSGGTSETAHNSALRRMEQAGVAPVTWVQVMLEWQRDWARRQTYDGVMKIVLDHAGAYGQGVEYAYTMVHKAPPMNERLKAAGSGH
jgi:nicotinamidase-related amidase